MNALWFSCASCGADNNIQAPAESLGMTRDKILPRCQCRWCGCVGADDMRRYFDPMVNALDGAREK